MGKKSFDLATEISETGWTPRIETGIRLLDDQHRHYFGLVNECLSMTGNASANKQVSPDKLSERLGFLRRYAVEHFATEQRIMKEAAYPDYQEHFDEHMFFLQRIGDLDKQLHEEGFSDKLARELQFQALEWFIGHIQRADMKLVEFLDQRAEQTGTGS
jgi:hemerythrin